MFSNYNLFPCLGRVVSAALFCLLSTKVGMAQSEPLEQIDQIQTDEGTQEGEPLRETVLGHLRSARPVEVQQGLSLVARQTSRFRSDEEIVKNVEKLTGDHDENTTESAAYILYRMTLNSTLPTLRQLAVSPNPLIKFYGAAAMVKSNGSMDDVTKSISVLLELLRDVQPTGEHRAQNDQLLEAVLDELKILAEMARLQQPEPPRPSKVEQSGEHNHRQSLESWKEFVGVQEQWWANNRAEVEKSVVAKQVEQRRP